MGSTKGQIDKLMKAGSAGPSRPRVRSTMSSPKIRRHGRYLDERTRWGSSAAVRGGRTTESDARRRGGRKGSKLDWSSAGDPPSCRSNIVSSHVSPTTLGVTSDGSTTREPTSRGLHHACRPRPNGSMLAGPARGGFTGATTTLKVWSASPSRRCFAQESVSECNLHSGDDGPVIRPVGSFEPNAWTLYDMIGQCLGVVRRLVMTRSSISVAGGGSA